MVVHPPDGPKGRAGYLFAGSCAYANLRYPTGILPLLLSLGGLINRMTELRLRHSLGDIDGYANCETSGRGQGRAGHQPRP